MIKEPYFYYKDNQLMVEDVPVEEIINKVGTPTYIYSTASFKEQLNQLQGVFKNVSSIICYSLKVCHNVNIIKFFINAGCGLAAWRQDQEHDQ